MKRAAIALLILFIMAAFCIVSLIYFDRSISEIIYHAGQMANAIEAQDTISAQQALDRLGNDWLRYQDHFRILSGSEPCEQLDRSLAQVKVWFLQKEKSPETLSELYDLIKKAEDLRKTQSPSIINLF